MLFRSYPSDYGYSTGSENDLERNKCLNNVTKWNEDGFDFCTQNNWLSSLQSKWTISSIGTDWHANDAVYIEEKRIREMYAMNVGNIFPTLYLKNDINFIGGLGTRENPYLLSI